MRECRWAVTLFFRPQKQSIFTEDNENGCRSATRNAHSTATDGLRDSHHAAASFRLLLLFLFCFCLYIFYENWAITWCDRSQLQSQPLREQGRRTTKLEACLGCTLSHHLKNQNPNPKTKTIIKKCGKNWVIVPNNFNITGYSGRPQFCAKTRTLIWI